jgi:hypothetical protein
VIRLKPRKFKVGFNLKTLATPINIQNFIDERGRLTVFENAKLLPFTIKRIYLLSDVSLESTRGQHAHKSLQQFIMCAQGSFSLKVSDGVNHQNLNLSVDGPGYFLDKGMWRELSNFQSGSIALILASEVYEADDYINDFKEFQKWKLVN